MSNSDWLAHPCSGFWVAQRAKRHFLRRLRDGDAGLICGFSLRWDLRSFVPIVIVHPRNAQSIDSRVLRIVTAAKDRQRPPHAHSTVTFPATSTTSTTAERSRTEIFQAQRKRTPRREQRRHYTLPSAQWARGPSIAAVLRPRFDFGFDAHHFWTHNGFYYRDRKHDGWSGGTECQRDGYLCYECERQEEGQTSRTGFLREYRMPKVRACAYG